MNKVKRTDIIRNSDVERYEMLLPLLRSLLEDMKELSKKKPDGILNKLKAAMINRILKQAKALLSKEPTAQFIDLLDEDTLPSNSDAVIILSQFAAAMRKFREKYSERGFGGIPTKWKIDKNL